MAAGPCKIKRRNRALTRRLERTACYTTSADPAALAVSRTLATMSEMVGTPIDEKCFDVLAAGDRARRILSWPPEAGGGRFRRRCDHWNHCCYPSWDVLPKCAERDRRGRTPPWAGCPLEVRSLKLLRFRRMALFCGLQFCILPEWAARGRAGEWRLASDAARVRSLKSLRFRRMALFCSSAIRSRPALHLPQMVLRAARISERRPLVEIIEFIALGSFCHFAKPREHSARSISQTPSEWINRFLR